MLFIGGPLGNLYKYDRNPVVSSASLRSHQLARVDELAQASRDAKPAIAQLVEHLTVDPCSNQMVPGSIPGGRIYIGVFFAMRFARSCMQELPA